MRGARGIGNGSQFLFHLDGHVDPKELEQRIRTLGARLPLLTSSLAGWPSRAWTEGAALAPVRVEEVPGSDERAFDDWFGRWFGEPFLPPSQPSLEVVVGRGEAGTAVLVRWLHLLSDAPGMDLFCRLLDGEDPTRFRLTQEPTALVKRSRRDRSAVQRILAVHALILRHLARSVPPPFQPRVDRRARQTVRVRTLTGEETAAVWQLAKSLGGLDRNGFLLGALARACVRAWSPASWRTLRIPVPVSLRPPAWRGPVLGNWFTMVLLHVPVRRLESLEAATDACREAWRMALERGEDVATMALMSPAGWLPGWLARGFLDGPILRDGATANTSYVELKTGARGTFLGQPLVRGAIASSILAPPGVAGVFSGCAGRLSVAVPGQVGEAGDALHRELLALLRGEVS